MNRIKKDKFIGNVSLDDVKVKIKNLEGLSTSRPKEFEKKDVSFNNENYLVSFDGEEYYIQKKCEEDGYKFLKTLSKQDLRTKYKNLFEHIEGKFVKKKSPTEVEVFFKSKKVPYDDFDLSLDGKDVFVQYVNKEKGTPKVTPAAYVKLAEELNKKGYNLVASNQQFSSGKILWDKLENEGYVKNVGNKKIIDVKSSSKDLENIVSGIFVFFFLLGLFLSTKNLTGNVVANFFSTENNFLGIGLILFGVIGFLIYRRFK